MKRIIEIPDKVVEAIQNGEDYRYDIHTAIAQSTPYNPSGDCISRSALKEAIDKDAEDICGIEDVIDYIDTAPTVEYPFYQEAYQSGYEECLKDFERLKGDCISRELLKKDIEAQISDFYELNKKGEPYKDIKDIRAILFGLVIGKNLIDNAPTVKYPFYQEAYQTGYEEGKNERPKGEWIPYTLWDYKCSNCEKVYGREYNFCPNCGAEMRKGGTE